jgi:hypothetical protein
MPCGSLTLERLVLVLEVNPGGRPEENVIEGKVLCFCLVENVVRDALRGVASRTCSSSHQYLEDGNVDRLVPNDLNSA